MPVPNGASAIISTVITSFVMNSGPLAGIGLVVAQLLICRQLIVSFKKDLSQSNWSWNEIVLLQNRLKKILYIIDNVNEAWCISSMLFSILMSIMFTMVGSGLVLHSFSFGATVMMVGSFLLFVCLYLLLYLPSVSLNEHREDIQGEIIKYFRPEEIGSIAAGSDVEDRSAILSGVSMLAQCASSKYGYMTAGKSFVLSRGAMFTTLSLCVSYIILILQFVGKS